MTYTNGSVYEGEWKRNKKHGRGKLSHVKDSSVYIGDFRFGARHGNGKLTIQVEYQKVEVYDGQWQDDVMHGFGTYCYCPQNRKTDMNCSVGAPEKYVGHWRFGLHDGDGTMIFQDGSVYSGEFKDGFLCGRGVLSHCNGWNYDGQFLKNQRHGLGTLTELNETYCGQFRHDRKHGRGELKLSDGSLLRAVWFNGYIVSERRIIVEGNAKESVNRFGK